MCSEAGRKVLLAGQPWLRPVILIIIMHMYEPAHQSPCESKDYDVKCTEAATSVIGNTYCVSHLWRHTRTHVHMHAHTHPYL